MGAADADTSSLGPGGKGNQEIAPLDVVEPANSVGEWLRPDRRVITLWRFQWVILLGVLAAAAVVGGRLLVTRSDFPELLVRLGFPLILLLLSAAAAWLPSRQWAAWMLYFDGRVVEIRSGLLTRVSVLIPVSRLQHVDLTQGILDRWLGLASLIVHTAATRHPSHRFPGLPVGAAQELRDRLVSAAHLDAAAKPGGSSDEDASAPE